MPICFLLLAPLHVTQIMYQIPNVMTFNHLMPNSHTGDLSSPRRCYNLLKA
jgi:hypothetical protein